MKHDWIIDVLSDLGDYARQNGLSALAVQLDDTRLVAHIEIASREEEARDGLRLHDWLDRPGSRRVGLG